MQENLGAVGITQAHITESDAAGITQAHITERKTFRLNVLYRKVGLREKRKKTRTV